MTHLIFFLVLGLLLLFPVVVALRATRDRGNTQYPQPPTDEELFEFHRQVNVKGACSRARD